MAACSATNKKLHIMQKSKYLVTNDRDEKWGLTVSTIGYEEIIPGDSYPTKGHADGYYFNLEDGR